MANWRLFRKCSEVYCGSVQLLRLLHTSESTQPLSSSLLSSVASSTLRTSSTQPQLIEVRTETVPRVHPQPPTVYMDTHKVVKDLQKAGLLAYNHQVCVFIVVIKYPLFF